MTKDEARTILAMMASDRHEAEADALLMAIDALSADAVSREEYEEQERVIEGLQAIIDNYKRNFIRLSDAYMESAEAVSFEDAMQIRNTILYKEYMRGRRDAVQVIRCKDCRHANECHKNVQYTHNEQSTITIGYTPIEWCSKGERKGGEDE